MNPYFRNTHCHAVKSRLLLVTAEHHARNYCGLGFLTVVSQVLFHTVISQVLFHTVVVLVEMPRKARYAKGTRVLPPRQQPPTAPPTSSRSADDDWLILPPPSNAGVAAAAPLRPFCLPRSEPRPKPQTANGVQVTEPCNEDMDPEANEVDLFDEHIDRMFAASDAEKRKGQKTTKFWDVDLIDSDGIVK
ncbi:hypothetical protein Ahy_A02g007902 isoform B [Arachis hypogaea]|uniref:Uncharacterized protein n=1 Tax=Arachis hypogaea TaxID=3818 RepID=A0A445EE48_ARAHY|nr:hypothetical protein Ahy_A02g007902 isoform B [Arachis hypogaea]